MKKIVLQFGLLAAALLGLMQLSKFSFFTQSLTTELWICIFALIFLAFGFLASRIFYQSPQIFTSVLKVNEKKLKKVGLSKREYEVLQQIEKGLSNQEIAQKLFISESTVKSHVSSILAKLEAKRRTQAITKAKKMEIL